LGLETPLDISQWKMNVITPVGTSQKGTGRLELNMDDIRALPKTQILTTFKCIEGWSEDMAFGGVKFSDFLKHYHLGTHSGQPPDFENNKNDLYAHVGLETPDGQYYVSIDMKSMLSPQTLLAYEMNGFPLTGDHGAPLRLVIPNKYGVKSLKRVGKIIFSDEKLPDYWGEQGYDWFIGL
jgi:DMSO/TMAO reductase YedYZ molybdopterin-dependent catalytic subunit